MRKWEKIQALLLEQADDLVLMSRIRIKEYLAAAV
jgi:hypothetical protein